MLDTLNSWIALVMSPELFWQLFWYVIAGGCATVVSQVGYSLCFRWLHMGNVWAKVLSWIAAASTAFVMMPLAFSTSTTPMGDAAWKFYGARIATAVLTVVLMWALMDWWLKWDLRDRERVKKEYGYWPEVINLAVTILENLINFFVAKFWIFYA